MKPYSSFRIVPLLMTLGDLEWLAKYSVTPSIARFFSVEWLNGFSAFVKRPFTYALPLRSLLVKFIKHKQNYYLKLDVSTSIRGFHQKKLVLSSSGSWHNGKTPCQESGRMRSSVGSCLITVVLLSFLSDVYGLFNPSGKNALALCRSPSLETSWWYGSLELRGRWEEGLSTSFFWWRPLIEVETSSFR